MSKPQTNRNADRKAFSSLLPFAICHLPFDFAFLAPFEEEGRRGSFTFAICDLPFAI